MRAAIYARKSQDDSDRNEENRSCTRQVEQSKAYAKAKGWTIDAEFIFVDDGISGAEYTNRPGFARLLASLPKRGKPPFDALIMSESSRLGRDMHRNSAWVISIIESGVRIFYYLGDEEERADTPEQRLMLTLKSYSSEVERLKAGQRSRDALSRKAAKGYNAGGIVYAYDNVPIYAQATNGEQTKSHTDYRVNEQQADVLRRIFTMYAAGHGHVTVAKTLNGDPRYSELSKRFFDGIRPPSPRKGTKSWAPTSVRAMLHNARYTGIVPFGRHRKVYLKGTKARVRLADSEVQRAQRPDLRIISEALWHEVQARLATVKKTYIRDTHGKLWGRPGSGVESKYLLTGLSSCGCCRRSIAMIGGRIGSAGTRRTRLYYGCSYHQNRGRTVCANDYRAHMDEANSVVLERAQRVLTPEAMDYVIDRALEGLAELQRTQRDRPARLEAELRTQRRQRDNLVGAIAEGKAPPSVIDRITALETSIAEKERELQTFTIEEPSELELRRCRVAFRKRLDQFHDLMLGEVPLARQALRKLVAGRIEFLPERRDNERMYHLRWSWVLKPLFDEEPFVQEGYIGVASPRGFEPRLLP